MMMDARTGSRFDLEQPAPQRRFDTKLRCDRGQAHGAWRLCRPWVEPGRADNVNWGIFGHHVQLLSEDLVWHWRQRMVDRRRERDQSFGSRVPTYPTPRIMHWQDRRSVGRRGM